MTMTNFKSRPTDQSPAARQRISGYIQELKDEFKKVSWTSKAELILYTKIVLGATFVFGIGVYLSDVVIKGILDGLKAIVFRIFG